MLDFNFTEMKHLSENDSSALSAVYFNENDNTALVLLSGSRQCYKYEGVDKEGYNALLNADSIGAHYNKEFKVAYGPSVDKEDGFRTFAHRVDIENPVIPPKNTDSSGGLVQNQFLDKKGEPTKEFSLQGNDSDAVDVTDVASHRGARVEETKEFSLDTPEVEEEVVDREANLWNYAVHFRIDGIDGKKVKTLTAYSPEEAIAEVEELADDLGVTINIYKVVITFE